MKVIELFANKKAVFSVEVFPPQKSGSIDSVYHTLENLESVHPDFVSVTYGAGGSGAGCATWEIAATIKNRYHIEPLVHLSCVNSSRTQVQEALDKLQACGVENILALRGDKNPDMPPKTDFAYASELAQMISSYGGFNIVGACYPEGHCESTSLKQDIQNLKYKVEAGATHLISQLFFDNQAFFRFVEQVRQAGIFVPIQAGIMPVLNKKQIERMVSMCGASLPPKLAKLINRYGGNEQEMQEAGLAYAVNQIADLLEHGVQGVHLYTMNNPLAAQKIGADIAGILSSING